MFYFYNIEHKDKRVNFIQKDQIEIVYSLQNIITFQSKIVMISIIRDATAVDSFWPFIYFPNM